MRRSLCFAVTCAPAPALAPALALALALVVLASGCIIDAKGKVCGYLGVLSDRNGVQYCRDDAATLAECERLNGALIAAEVPCAEGAIDENTARANLTDREQLELNCGNAGATTLELEQCIEELEDDEDPPCEGGQLDKPNVCRGVLLDSIFSDNLPG